MNFEWDEAKAASNLRKHGVSFEEAASAFEDPQGSVEYDESHSQDEDRWRVIGFSSRLRLPTVSYTKRHETIRLISARRATKAEASRYADAG